MGGRTPPQHRRARRRTVPGPMCEWSGLPHAPPAAVAADAGEDLALRLLRTDPAREAHPLARLAVLVVLEEMRDLRQLDFGQVARRPDRAVERRQLVDRPG